MIYRLYEVDRKTSRKTGKKRDYVSEELFLKFAKYTYERYNQEDRYPRGVMAEIRFLNENDKWELLPEKELEILLNKLYGK